MATDLVRLEPLPTMLIAIESLLTLLPFALSVKEGTANAEISSVLLSLPDALTPALAFEGGQLKSPAVFVSVPTSTNSGQYRGAEAVDVAEQIVVTLAYRIRPMAARSGRNEAIRLEEMVRARVMRHAAPLRQYRPAYVGAARGPAETPSLTAEWWISTQTFELHRAASVDG